MPYVHLFEEPQEAALPGVMVVVVVLIFGHVERPWHFQLSRHAPALRRLR